MTGIVLAARHNMVFEMTMEGNIYWVDEADYPTDQYKNLFMSGLMGMIKAVVSPSGDLMAVGGS